MRHVLERNCRGGTFHLPSMSISDLGSVGERVGQGRKETASYRPHASGCIPTTYLGHGLWRVPRTQQALLILIRGSIKTLTNGGAVTTIIAGPSPIIVSKPLSHNLQIITPLSVEALIVIVLLRPASVDTRE